VNNPVVEEDLESIVRWDLPWSAFAGKTVLVSGASGFLPAWMVETLLRLNEKRAGQATRVIGLVRNLDKAARRFAAYRGREDLLLLRHDVTEPLAKIERADFVIHAASQASPKFFGSDPVGTLSANVFGTHHLLDFARQSGAKGLLFLSSAEVYGQRDPSAGSVRECDYGAVDPTNVRSCYAESKRMGETMCACWWRQFGVPAKIVRPFHTYGPGMSLEDGRVFADFVADVVHRRPVVLRSAGTARRAFCYVADAVAGFFAVLLNGKSGEAYNIGNDQAECSVGELADLLVALFPEYGLKVVRSEADLREGYLPSEVSRIAPDIRKARSLGWHPTTGLAEGFRRTVRSFEWTPG